MERITDSVETTTSIRRTSSGRPVIRFGAYCHTCGAHRMPEWSTAGMSASWSARHRGLDVDTPESEICTAVLAERAVLAVFEAQLVGAS